MNISRMIGSAVVAVTCTLTPDPAGAWAADSASAATLRARQVSLADKLTYNQFRRPLVMESIESPNGISGEIHALISYPFAAVGKTLTKPSEWCELLLLHLNTKYCHASTEGGKSLVQLNIGAKHDQPLAESHRVNFVYAVGESSPDYLQVNMNAEDGPMGTRNYRIAFEATPAPEGKTFIHLSYSYAFGVAGRIAMMAYLGSAGRDKVGFTLMKDGGGAPAYIGGLRGVVERNTMRYYLAIDAYLGAQSAPAAARLEKSLRDWFASVERYPRQLHEMDSADYMAMKRLEYTRQRAG